MRTLVVLLALGFVAVTAVPSSLRDEQHRIVGGTVTTINNYPAIAALLLSFDRIQWIQSCGGNIINNRSILTAAHCIASHALGTWRVRVGSTWANSGGVVHLVNAHILHPQFNRLTIDSDLAIMRLSSTIGFNNNVQAAPIAGANYHVADNQVVWIAGWGRTSYGGSPSEQLRHVQVWSINQGTCRSLYGASSPPRTITDNMMCAGVLNQGGRDACTGDSGGPMYHNRIVAGVTSWGLRCADPRFPGVYVRLQRFTNWIRNNS